MNFGAKGFCFREWKKNLSQSKQKKLEKGFPNSNCYNYLEIKMLIVWRWKKDEKKYPEILTPLKATKPNIPDNLL